MNYNSVFNCLVLNPADRSESLNSMFTLARNMGSAFIHLIRGQDSPQLFVKILLKIIPWPVVCLSLLMAEFKVKCLNLIYCVYIMFIEI